MWPGSSLLHRVEEGGAGMEAEGRGHGGDVHPGLVDLELGPNLEVHGGGDLVEHPQAVPMSFDASCTRRRLKGGSKVPIFVSGLK